MSLPHPPKLTDRRIALRPWALHDAPALHALCQDPDVVRWTRVPADYTLEMARQRAARAEDERVAGAAVRFAVVDASTDELLGSCDLVSTGSAHRMEVAYMLAPWARGRGVMTAAVRLLAAYAHNQLGVTRLEIFAHPDNVASVAVAERAGFSREGLLRRYRLAADGTPQDRVLLSLLAGE